MSSNFFVSLVTKITDYIVKELGGTITVSEDKILNVVKIRLTEKDEKTKKIICFDEAVSYEELSTIVDPTLIGKRFVEHYKSQYPPKKKRRKRHVR